MDHFLIIIELIRSLLALRDHREGKWGYIGLIDSIISFIIVLFIRVEVRLIWTMKLLKQIIIFNQYEVDFTIIQMWISLQITTSPYFLAFHSQPLE